MRAQPHTFPVPTHSQGSLALARVLIHWRGDRKTHNAWSSGTASIATLSRLILHRHPVARHRVSTNSHSSRESSIKMDAGLTLTTDCGAYAHAHAQIHTHAGGVPAAICVPELHAAELRRGHGGSGGRQPGHAAQLWRLPGHELPNAPGTDPPSLSTGHVATAMRS